MKKTLLLPLFLLFLTLSFTFLKGKLAFAAEASKTDTPTFNSFVEIAEQVKSSVVNIRSVQLVEDKSDFHGFGNRQGPEVNPFDRFFENSPNKGFSQRNLGSGFIIDHDGYIVTNDHVVKDADEILVRLSDETEYEARIVGRDSKTDLAVIKIDALSKMPFLKLGSSKDLKIGEWVIAIGNPFGLEHTVTVGIVSAKGRIFGSGPYDEFIQTDAPINPGNSGGPLLNIRGEVVGINTAILLGGKGISFAIPSNLAEKIILQLKEKGKVSRGWLGVYIQDITSELMESFGLEDKKGVLISRVVKGGPADKAGLKDGNVILSFNGRRVEDVQSLQRAVVKVPAGEEVLILLWREGKRKEVKLKIGEMQEIQKVQKETPIPYKRRLGLVFDDLTPDQASQYERETAKGAIVVNVIPGSPAYRANLRRNDIIISFNGIDIKNAKDLVAKIESLKKGDIARFFLLRGQRTLFAALRMD